MKLVNRWKEVFDEIKERRQYPDGSAARGYKDWCYTVAAILVVAETITSCKEVNASSIEGYGEEE